MHFAPAIDRHNFLREYFLNKRTRMSPGAMDARFSRCEISRQVSRGLRDVPKLQK